MNLRNTLWHGWLRRPYRLYKALDEGQGSTVVFLHGLGRSSDVWRHAAEMLDSPADRAQVRMIAYDLLGFGQSPKPEHLQYTVDDHARAVVAALMRLPQRARPVIIVGHSMGCLIAVRVARLRPDLVRHLILYEMPLYSGLPDKRRYRMRLRLYFTLYERIVSFKPIFQEPGKTRAQKLAEKLTGFTLDDNTWRPFIRSLKHTIMEQTTSDDLRHVKVPMDVIYGRLDQVVIRGKVREVFGEDAQNITAHTIRESHTISRRATRFLLTRLAAIVGNKAPARHV
jgi:pimeloyl-ACP methyl ester carboxylesterase